MSVNHSESFFSVDLTWDTCLMMVQDPQENAIASILPHWLSSLKTWPPPPAVLRPRVELQAVMSVMGKKSSERHGIYPGQFIFCITSKTEMTYLVLCTNCFFDSPSPCRSTLCSRFGVNEVTCRFYQESLCFLLMKCILFLFEHYEHHNMSFAFCGRS